MQKKIKSRAQRAWIQENKPELLEAMDVPKSQLLTLPQKVKPTESRDAINKEQIGKPKVTPDPTPPPKVNPLTNPPELGSRRYRQNPLSKGSRTYLTGRSNSKLI